jgi:hypothetical protein
MPDYAWIYRPNDRPNRHETQPKRGKGVREGRRWESRRPESEGAAGYGLAGEGPQSNGTEKTGQVITVRVAGADRVGGPPPELVYPGEEWYSPQHRLVATPNAAIAAEATNSIIHES